MEILFVCSRNQWRSPTAEAIYKNSGKFQVRSTGTESSARIKMTLKHFDWADIIFVIKKNHKERIIQLFGRETQQKQIIILEISDDHKFMDPELVGEIITSGNVSRNLGFLLIQPYRLSFSKTDKSLPVLPPTLPELI